ncbi:MAG: hypothetical protein MJA28_12780, partial [Gammaproteobacteria bacterium]|nr:hypothetical protein [Gammaproteobacteria bacterium]
MATWDLKELRELIADRGGKKCAEDAEPYIQSFAGKFDLLSVHFHEARSVFPDFYNKSSPSTIDAFRAMLSTGEKRNNFSLAKLKYEAFALGAVQTQHSVSDVLAHLLAVAMGLPESAEAHLTLPGVKKQLPDKGLKVSIDKFLGLSEYRFLQDFVNINKHMRLVDARYHISTPENGEERHGVRFKSFSYSGRHHLERWGDQLFSELKKVAEAQVGIGMQLNTVLGR